MGEVHRTLNGSGMSTLTHSAGSWNYMLAGSPVGAVDQYAAASFFFFSFSM